MDRRQNRPQDHEEHTELQRIGSLVKSSCYIIGLVILAPLFLNRIAKAVDSNIVYSQDFYKVVEGKL